MRVRLARYFDRKRCLSTDELVDETLNRVARRLEEEGEISAASPAHYCYIVAKFVFLEHARLTRVHPIVMEPEDGSPSFGRAKHLILDPREAEQKLLDCLELCLRKMVPKDRELILEYYRGEHREKIQRRRELSESLGLTTNALTIRACRIRDKLEGCVKKCSEER